MFQFPGLAAMQLCIHCMLIQVSWAHHLFVGSPKLFADFHAFRRLSIPRHPPCALSNLTIGISHSNPISSKAASTKVLAISQNQRQTTQIASRSHLTSAIKLPTSIFNPGVNQNQTPTRSTFAYILLRSFENSFDPLPIYSGKNSEEPNPNKPADEHRTGFKLNCIAHPLPKPN